MEKFAEIDLIGILQEKINKCVELVCPKEKVKDVEDLIDFAVKELLRKEFKNAGEAEHLFKNFVNRTLSAIEMIDIDPMKYKAVRKNINHEIYGCLFAFYPELKPRYQNNFNNNNGSVKKGI